MVSSNEFKKILYEHEVLWARYEISDHYLNKIVQEVYENIGQVLSLIRVQLSLLSNDTDSTKVNATEPGNLVGKVIGDLRGMCKGFFPEKELLTKLGFIRTLEYELKLLGAEKAENLIKVKGLPKPLPVGTELIVFCMLLEILSSIATEYKGWPIGVKISYDKNNVTFIIEYAGKPIEWKQPNLQVDANLSLTRLNLSERAELIDAILQVHYNKAQKTCIKLKVPFKTLLYE